MIWEKYASQNNPHVLTFKNKTEKYELTQNAYIAKSLFYDIGNEGALCTIDSSVSIVIELTIFDSCRNENHGGSISVSIIGSASFSLLHSCIYKSKCLGSSTYGAAFCIDGRSKYHPVQISLCSMTENFAQNSDGISIWYSEIFFGNINSSNNNANNEYAGISAGDGNLFCDKFSIYSKMTSKTILYLYTNSASYFRCIFCDCTPIQPSAFFKAYRGNKMSVQSCTFERIQGAYFSTLDNSVIVSLDCFFDQNVGQYPGVDILSPGVKFESFFTIPGRYECNIRHTMRKSRCRTFRSLVWILFASYE